MIFDADLQHSPEEIPTIPGAACGRLGHRVRQEGRSSMTNGQFRPSTIVCHASMFRVPASDLNSMKAFRSSVSWTTYGYATIGIGSS